jgi:hypothetical protein
MPLPSIVLDFETPYYIDGKTFIEIINPNKARALIDSEYLEECYDPNNYSQRLSSIIYKNEREQLEAYIASFNKKAFGYQVKYGLPRHKLGRVNPKKALGLTCFRKQIRNTLIHGNYVDIDLCNAQPSISYNLCIHNDIPCPILTKLINNREEILQMIMTHYDVNRSKAKKLILRLSFYGTVYGWKMDNGLDMNIPDIPFIIDLIKEYKMIALAIKEKNQPLFNKVKLLSDNKSKKKTDEEFLGSFMGYYLQSYELRIIDCVIQWLCEETKILDIINCKFKVLTYEYDGIKLHKFSIEKYNGGINQLIRDMQNIIKERTGFEVIFEEKPIESEYELEYNENAIENDLSFETVCNEFEKNHCKIINKVLYVKKDNNKNILFKQDAIKNAYSHLFYECPVYDKEGNLIENKKMSFIKKWTGHTHDIRKYDDMNVYPNKSLCPENEYNLWVDFEMENVDECEHKQEELDAILKHIKILCNNQEDVYNYFIGWIAHMIQYPEKKSTMVTFISKEGVGK